MRSFSLRALLLAGVASLPALALAGPAGADPPSCSIVPSPSPLVVDLAHADASAATITLSFAGFTGEPGLWVGLDASISSGHSTPLSSGSSQVLSGAALRDLVAALLGRPVVADESHVLELALAQDPGGPEPLAPLPSYPSSYSCAGSLAISFVRSPPPTTTTAAPTTSSTPPAAATTSTTAPSLPQTGGGSSKPASALGLGLLCSGIAVLGLSRLLRRRA